MLNETLSVIFKHRETYFVGIFPSLVNSGSSIVSLVNWVCTPRDNFTFKSRSRNRREELTVFIDGVRFTPPKFRSSVPDVPDLARGWKFCWSLFLTFLRELLRFIIGVLLALEFSEDFSTPGFVTGGALKEFVRVTGEVVNFVIRFNVDFNMAPVPTSFLVSGFGSNIFCLAMEK